MQSATGKVIDGQIVLDRDEPLPERARVVVEFFAEDEELELTDEEDAELAERIDEIRRGEYVTAEDFLNRRKG